VAKEAPVAPAYCPLPPGWRAVVNYHDAETGDLQFRLYPMVALMLIDGQHVPVYRRATRVGCFVDETGEGAEPVWCLAPGEHVTEDVQTMCKARLTQWAGERA
jgi:hypothetical protein